MIKGYQKYVAENRNLVYVSTFIVILLRLCFLFTDNEYLQDKGDFLWYLFTPFFANKYVAFACSLLFTIGIGLQITHLNGKYGLIRGKTSLPYVFTIFLLSASPALIFMTTSHLGVVAILLCVDRLFDSYHNQKSSRQAFSIGFIIALGSLVIPGILLFLFVFWIGFFQMRSFSLKSFFASLFGVVMIYWLAISYLFFQQQIDDVYIRFISEINIMDSISVLWMDMGSIITFSIYTIVVLIVIIGSYVDKFKDKIQVRTNLSFLKLTFIFSVLAYFFITLHPQFYLVTAIVISGFIFAHYFALVDKKWKVYFFIVLVVFYLLNYLYLLIK